MDGKRLPNNLIVVWATGNEIGYKHNNRIINNNNVLFALIVYITPE